MMLYVVPGGPDRARTFQPSILLVLALLVVSAVLVTVPALRAPSAADVCWPASPEEGDELEANKMRAALLVAFGALTSFAAAAVAIFTAPRRPRASERPNAARPHAREPGDARGRVRESTMFWAAVAAATLLALGSLGPWARIVVVRVSGLEMDGWIAVLGALIAGAMLYRYARRRTASALVGAGLGGLLGLAIVVLRATDIFGQQAVAEHDSLFVRGGDEDLVTPGWGLFASGIGATALIATTFVLYRRQDVTRGSEAPRSRRLLISVAILGVLGGLIGLSVAFFTVLIVC